LSPHGEVKVELERVFAWCGELGVRRSLHESSGSARRPTSPRRFAPVARALDVKVVPIAIPIGSTGISAAMWTW